MISPSMIGTVVPESARHVLTRYRAHLAKELASDVEALVLYGSLVRGEYIPGRSNINVLLVLRECSVQALGRCGRIHRRWEKEGIVAPLVMTKEELTRSGTRFPLELLEIKDHHLVLEGRDPFSEVCIDDTHLAFQCEQDIAGNLIRVRQRYIEGLARHEAVAALLPVSLTSLVACLRGLFRVLGHPAAGTAAATLERLPEVLQVDPNVFQEVLHMKRGLSSPGALELPRMLERYLRGLEQVLQRIDALKEEGRLR